MLKYRRLTSFVDRTIPNRATRRTIPIHPTIRPSRTKAATPVVPVVLVPVVPVVLVPVVISPFLGEDISDSVYACFKLVEFCYELGVGSGTIVYF